ncbi:MAG: DUF502 domain-containing protein [Nitrospirota bacterium]
MKKLARYFLEGLLFLVPMVVTIYVIYIVFVKIDGIFKFKTPGLGVLVTLLLITGMGLIASNFLTRGFLRIMEKVLLQLPVVKLIYGPTKILINAFLGEKKSLKPVLVTILPESDIKAIGFITLENLNNLGLSDHVAVYFPQSYNFAGNLVIVPKGQVTPLNIESGEVLAMIISGGITSQENI